MATDGNCHSFMSQSVMTMSNGPDGRPQVYQETMSTRMAPGGIKETKQTVSDSRTGTRKMAIGHHIGERAHILERERNMHGEEEERQEFINLDEGNFLVLKIIYIVRGGGRNIFLFYKVYIFVYLL